MQQMIEWADAAGVALLGTIQHITTLLLIISLTWVAVGLTSTIAYVSVKLSRGGHRNLCCPAGMGSSSPERFCPAVLFGVPSPVSC